MGEPRPRAISYCIISVQRHAIFVVMNSARLLIVADEEQPA